MLLCFLEQQGWDESANWQGPLLTAQINHRCSSSRDQKPRTSQSWPTETCLFTYTAHIAESLLWAGPALSARDFEWMGRGSWSQRRPQTSESSKCFHSSSQMCVNVHFHLYMVFLHTCTYKERDRERTELGLREDMNKATELPRGQKRGFHQISNPRAQCLWNQ